MTSDAKIGLLLGLVFIFVIAFIINGLPNLKPQQATRADVPVVVGFDGQEVGITGRTKAEADRDWTTLATPPQEPAPAIRTPVEQPSTVVAETPAAEPQVAGGQDVRYEAFLPGAPTESPRTESLLPRVDNPLGRIESILNRFAASQQGPGTSTVDMSTMPPATVEKLLPSASLALSINGVNYVSNKNIVSLETSWKNNVRLDGGFFPGSGFQTPGDGASGASSSTCAAPRSSSD